MNLILFDHQNIRKSLLPLTFTRPVSELRIGILKLSEKWEKHLETSISFLADSSLSALYPCHLESENFLINGAVCPTEDLIIEIKKLNLGEALYQKEILIAFKTKEITDFDRIDVPETFVKKEYSGEFVLLENTYSIFQKNGEEIKRDFELLSKGRTSEILSDKHSILYASENIFIEKGAKIKAAILNAENGPIYIGKDATIEEGSILKGPIALCDNAQINMGAKIRENTTIGPFCKVGGEVNNVVFWGYSSKGHDGFLGNSVIGQWCNLGADTNCSNLKNNYSDVKIWSYLEEKNIDTGLQFCGLIMGDHAKAGINTMFNTGTVVGVAANVFGAGFPAKFIPSFCWGGIDSNVTFSFDKMLEVARKVMARRGEKLEEKEIDLFKKILNSTQKYRVWEKN